MFEYSTGTIIFPFEFYAGELKGGGAIPVSQSIGFEFEINIENTDIRLELSSDTNGDFVLSDILFNVKSFYLG